MQTLRIDIVSDIACPWCAIGYRRLEAAMAELRDEFAFECAWHPFELAPDMAAEGEPILPHLARKYGRSEAEIQATQQDIIAAADHLGLNFDRFMARRAVNTFDAHRVLEWAREQGCQTNFKMALFDAYFGRAEDPSDPPVLKRIASDLGLDTAAVDAILASDAYGHVVREQEQHYMAAGVSAVPAFVVDSRYLISGAQEPPALTAALRRAAAGAAATA